MRLPQQVGFMDLADSYGRAQEGQRYYAHTLEETLEEAEKAVTYQSFPAAKPMPDAMKPAIEHLWGLVK